jgi:O-antigen biosynthesis protein
MRYTILTPTILRPSLLRACQSVDSQTCKDYHHIVIVDSEISDDLIAKIAHPQRTVVRCDKPHNDWGHTCCHQAWALATGDYVLRLDDDNYLADDNVLEDLKVVDKPWAIFPITRFGERFFNDPPGVRKTDSGSILVRRDAGPWPALSQYDTDGIFVVELLGKHPYQALPDSRPLMICPHSAENVEITTGNRVSIYTPVHDISYLPEVYKSIKDQDFYEWIVVYNNGGVPLEFNDPRVKSRVLYKAPEKVGTLKAYACDQATGDILLELDCDDLLMPTAIEEVQKAFADPEIGFVYSNAIHATGDLEKFPRYDEIYGWKFREVEFAGKMLDECVSFPPTPEAVSRVWYAPDHLRAFRRSVYHQIGGYDKSMKILDDSDIICRAYLATKFKHIDKPLYVYRVHGNNSWLKYNKEIQDGVYKIYDQYIGQLADRWAKQNGLMVLDDINILPMLPENSVGVIRSTSLCMIPDPIRAMKEIARVLAPGGMAMLTVPSTDGRGAYQDPRHKSFWNENSFLYYTNKNWAKYIDTPVRFQATRLYTTEKDERQVCWTVCHLVNLKGSARPPGLIEI